MSDLSELFARDPLRLTREDRRPMIEAYRANREKFIAGQKTEKVSKPAKPKVERGKLNLGDLGL